MSKNRKMEGKGWGGTRACLEPMYPGYRVRRRLQNKMKLEGLWRAKERKI